MKHRNDDKLPTNAEAVPGAKQAMELQQFARNLFMSWDKKQFGKIKVVELARNFISLGLAENELVAVSVLKNLIRNN
jgi:hypothetical protein